MIIAWKREATHKRKTWEKSQTAKNKKKIVSQYERFKAYTRDFVL